MKLIGADDKPYCGWVGWPIHGPNRTLVGGGITLARLAHELGALILDRNVMDHTGISGLYNIRLEYAPDENTRCFGPAQFCAVDPNSDIPPGPTVFAALEQQLVPEAIGAGRNAPLAVALGLIPEELAGREDFVGRPHDRPCRDVFDLLVSIEMKRVPLVEVRANRELFHHREARTNPERLNGW